MGIVQRPTRLIGEEGYAPASVLMVSTDNLATVSAAGYINPVVLEGSPVLATDVFGVIYSYNLSTGAGTYAIMTPSISNGIITLVPWSNPGDVLLPVVSGDFAIFNGTTGQIKDAGYSPSNASLMKVSMVNGATTNNGLVAFADTAGTIHNPSATSTSGFGITSATGSFTATLGGFIGGSAAGGNNASLQLFPTTATTGSLRWIAAANGGNFNVDFTNASFGQATVFTWADPGSATAKPLISGAAVTSGHFPAYSGTAGLTVDSGIAATNIQTSSLTSPDAISDLIWYDITATAAALATAGKVNVQVSSGSKQYKVRNIIVNYAAAGLSGGGGNQLLVLSDGTTVYNNAGITAALLGTPVNTLWGGTGNPVAGTVAQNTSSVAGANIFLQYAGGGTDYTTGQIVISVLVQRVA